MDFYFCVLGTNGLSQWIIVIKYCTCFWVVLGFFWLFLGCPVLPGHLMVHQLPCIKNKDWKLQCLCRFILDLTAQFTSAGEETGNLCLEIQLRHERNQNFKLNRGNNKSKMKIPDYNNCHKVSENTSHPYFFSIPHSSGIQLISQPFPNLTNGYRF